MITIQSTDAERYEELKDRKLTVCMWDSTKEMKITNPEESIAKALKVHASRLQLVGSSVRLEGIREPVNINMPTIKESISTMTKQHADLLNLAKLFTVLQNVAENAILIEVESFRHNQQKPKKAETILDVSQYISAFCDQNILYPVKITAERRRNFKETNIHVTITIGTIPINELQKEELSILRMHPFQINGESVDSGRNSSFDIILPQLVKYFNESEAILIKNLPDQMLSEKQQEIKEKLVRFDKEKEIAKQIEQFRRTMTEAAERGENMVYKVVPHEYSEQMRQAMLKSGICFIPFTTDDGYLNIVVQEKDADAFLQIQTVVFQREKEKEKIMENEVNKKSFEECRDELDNIEKEEYNAYMSEGGEEHSDD